MILYNSPGSHKRLLLFIDDGWVKPLSEILSLGFVGLIKHLGGVFGPMHGSSGVFAFMFIFALGIFSAHFFKSNAAKIAFFISSAIVFLVLNNNVNSFLLVLCIIAILGFLSYRFYVLNLDLEFRLFLAFLAIFCIYTLYKGTEIQIGIPPRASTQFALLSFAGLAVIIYYLVAKFKLDSIYKAFNILLIICAIAYASFVAIECANMRFKWEQMIGSIEAQKALGQESVLVSRDTFISRYKRYGDWGNPGDDPQKWPNNTYAKHFGVKEFILKD